MLGDDLADAAEDLLDQLLARQAATGAVAEPAVAEPRELDASRHSGGSASEVAHPHAWKAGPILLIAGGVTAFVAVGVAAAIRSDDQQLNTAAVATWSAIGAAAIGGGTAWWVVGKKRRQQGTEAGRIKAPAIGLSPTRIDLRLRF